MNTEEMINSLNDDLSRELSHMHFYLLSASVVTGLHRHAVRQFLLDGAKSEMQHVLEFSDKIVGLGGVPTTKIADFPNMLTKPEDILKHIVFMEEEVLRNYVKRRDQADELQDRVVGVDLIAFLEEQINDSKSDLDNVRQMLQS